MACAASAPRRSPRRCSPASARAERCPLAEADVCCGFGGLFSVKMPDVSSAMLGAQARHDPGKRRRHGRRHRRELRHAHGRRPPAAWQPGRGASTSRTCSRAGAERHERRHSKPFDRTHRRRPGRRPAADDAENGHDGYSRLPEGRASAASTIRTRGATTRGASAPTRSRGSIRTSISSSRTSKRAAVTPTTRRPQPTRCATSATSRRRRASSSP